MSDIPDDVLRAAKAAMVDGGFENAASDTFTTYFVVRAILAERERCAKIADAYREDVWGCPEEQSAAFAIAASIRGTE